MHDCFTVDATTSTSEGGTVNHSAHCLSGNVTAKANAGVAHVRARSTPTRPLNSAFLVLQVFVPDTNIDDRNSDPRQCKQGTLVYQQPGMLNRMAVVDLWSTDTLEQIERRSSRTAVAGTACLFASSIFPQNAVISLFQKRRSFNACHSV